MPDTRGGTPEQSLKTIDVVRRDYGRRYTGLPVDTIDRQSFTIDCNQTYMRPAMFDLRPGDTVRWVKNGRYLEGTIASVERTETLIRAVLDQVKVLPADFSPW